MGQTGAKVRATKSRRNFLQWIHLIHPHWILNSYFFVFCTIWVHLGLFGCLTKLRAKWAEVGQKFVPWSCFGIFWNDHNRSTSLDPNLMFWCVSYYLGAFGTVWLPYKTWCKTSRSGAKVRDMKSCRNFSQWTTRSTQLDPKLMFWRTLYYSGVFGTVWLPYETRCKIGRTRAKVRATKSRRKFSQRTHLIYPIGP